MEKFILCLSVFLINLILTVIIESKLIPFLSKKAKQPIYKEGPSWHLSKSGTPTMGGIAFVISISLSMLILSVFFILDNNATVGISLLLSALFSLTNSLIGIFDDLMKLYRKENAGLSPIQKLGLQFILSVLFLMGRSHLLGDGAVFDLGFCKINLDALYYPIALILLLGVINCANLTDGIDGLATGVAISIGIVFLIIGYSFSYDLPILSSALVGGGCGFLFFNANPAKIFMGDTGSLFLGALAASLAFSFRNPLLIIPIGIVYVIEGASVILQVIAFRLTGKRIFKMAPLHHHLEKCGLKENTICIIGIAVTIFSSIATLLLRRIYERGL